MQVAQAQQGLERAVAERAAVAAEKEEAARRIEELGSEIVALQEELQAARVQGTPMGEGECGRQGSMSC